MSEPFDILIPPVTSPIDIPKMDLVEEPEGLENYTFVSSKGMWVCRTCEGYVANPDGHTDWHKHLLEILDNHQTSSI